VALLRVLEMGSFQRVGGTETIKVDVRVICATNQDLSSAVRDKTFREDLYYRINVISLPAPSLRSRKADIPLLVNFFFELYRRKTSNQIAGFSEAALTRLCEYAWPGNVRQLANVIEHSVIFCQGRYILPEHLPEEVRQTSHHDFLLTLHDSSLSSAEAALILAVLEDKDWHLTQAAEALGVARGTLYSKMERYRIHKPS
jgi:two-component system NtrC family response regulator/two-component system response regulator HydG